MQSYLDELNEAQRRAVEHTGSPLLILAGAGSGKTKTLTYKAAHLLHEGKVSNSELMLVTFTNKAAGEMKERVGAVAGQTLANVGTFHSLAARILRTGGERIGVGRDFVIYDDSDAEELIKQIQLELSQDPKRFKPRTIMSMISSAKQELVSAIDYQGMARGYYQEAAANVYSKYQTYLRAYNAVDFDDLLGLTVKLLKNDESTRQKYQTQLRAVFVDEYQDTNTAQYELTKLLVGEGCELTVVGDAAQSIYRFRGADYRNMNRLKQDYPNLTEIRLERNYRSTQNILDAATSLIGHNKNHTTLSLWTEAGKGEAIKLIEAYSGSDEARAVVEVIVREHSAGREWREIAILYRTNAQSRLIEEALIRSSIPYVLVGGTKFYERKEIKDLLSYLRLMLNPGDKVSYARAEKAGKRRLTMVLALREKAEVEKIAPAELLGMILEASSYLSQFDDEIEEEAARIENVKELQNVAAEFDNLAALLENVALVQAEYYAGEKKGVTKSEAVTLMTLHAAKGLEYPIVFMVGLEEGLFPHSRSMMELEELEEERRLMYVGVTRAKEKLFLSYAKQRTVWGNTGYQTRSRFVDEIPANLIQSVGQPDHSEGRRGGGLVSLIKSKSEKEFWESHGAQFKTKKTGVRIDSLSDSTLDDFLSGNMSIEELLSR